jgi:hypothetical protein
LQGLDQIYMKPLYCSTQTNKNQDRVTICITCSKRFFSQLRINLKLKL